MSKRIIWLVAIVVGGLGILWVLKTRSATVRNAVVLADGTTLTLEPFTYGKKHTLIDGNPWVARVKEFLPFRWRNSLKSGNSMTHTTDEDQLVGWVTQRTPAGTYIQPKAGLYRVLDEHGCVLFSSGLGTMSAGGLVACPLDLTAFPRDQKTFRVEVYDHNNVLMTQFTGVNPVRPSSAPVWKPLPLPQTVTNGDLAFTLNSVKYHTNLAGVWYQPVFAVKQNGKPITAWDQPNNTWVDARGNSNQFGGGLCTREPAWKLSTRFFRGLKAAFATNEVWAVTNVVVPAPGTSVMIGASNSLQGVTLQLLDFAGAGSFTYSNNLLTSASAPIPGISGRSFGSSSFSQGTNMIETMNTRFDSPHVAVSIHGLTDDHRLFIRLTDQLGRVHQLSNAGGCNTVTFYDGKLPGDATNVRLEIIVQKARAAEFVISPPVRPLSTP